MSLSHGMMCRNLRNSQFSNCSRTFSAYVSIKRMTVLLPMQRRMHRRQY
jgi:hypothetical protein